MSYYAIFKAPKEKVEKLKYDSRNTNCLDEGIHTTKMDLLLICMQDNTESDSYQLYKKIKFGLDSLKFLVEKQTENSVYNRYIDDNDGEFWFCGWQYAGEYTGMELNDAEECVIEKLLLLSKIVKTPDYFEDEDKFLSKINAIISEIDFFIETISTITDFKIMDDFKEYRIGENLDIDEIECKTKDNK